MIQWFSQTIWLVPLYALIGGCLALPWSPAILRRLGSRPAGYLNMLMTFFAFGHSVIALWEVWGQPARTVSLSWLSAAGLDITFDVKIQAISVSALALVTGLNFLAQVFAVGYLEMDWGWARFYSLLGFFEAGMCGLILCNSLFFSYVYLEMLTLATYLIVGFWYAQPLVITGARDAFWTKRVGDLLLLMGVIALYPLAGTWNYDSLAAWAANANLSPLTANLLCLALVAGPLAKCAQFPFQLWLDEAMEAPIPASILRNSVVVAVGAYVVIQLQPVLTLSSIALNTLIFIGGMTAIGATLIAIAQIDIKRSLSYLVSAYLGLVFIAVGTQQDETALLLLFTHAIAMALLFMCIGAIIWVIITQDLTKMGGLWSRRPVSGIAFIVGAASLTALPPFGSFWTFLKLADHLWTTQPWLVGIILLVNGLTAFSLTRVFSLIFGGKPTPMTERAPEAHWLMTFPMVILMGFALHVPLLFKQWSLLPTWETLNITLAGMLTLSTLIGCSLGVLIYLTQSFPNLVTIAPKSVQELLSHDFYIQQIYRVTIVGLVNFTAKISTWLDHYIVDGAVNLVGLSTLLSGQALKYTTSGQSQFYILSILLGLVFAVIFLL